MSDLRVVPGITPPMNVSKHIARYNAALPYCQNLRVLDAACGVGYGTRILSMVAKNVTGWDIEKTVIDQARSDYSAKNTAFYAVDLENIGQKDQIGAYSPFEVIVSFETLEHLENPTKVLDSFSELLVPGGLLVASLPLNETKTQNEHHRHTYVLESAKQLLKDYRPITELVQHSLSFYPTELADQFPDDPVYYLFAGIKQ